MKLKINLPILLLLLTFTNSQGQVDTLTDVRDGKNYRVVELNGIKWMIDNLDYATEHSYKLDSKEFPNSDLSGRYYPFFERDSICPNKWSLPQSEDWLNYFHYIYDSLGVQAKIQGEDKYYPAVLHKYVESINLDLFTENNPIELKPNFMIEGGQLVKTHEAANYWTENEYEEYKDKSHAHIRNNTLTVHSHKGHLQRKKPKKMRMFMARCVLKKKKDN